MTVIWVGTTNATPASEKAIDFDQLLSRIQTTLIAKRLAHPIKPTQRHFPQRFFKKNANSVRWWITSTKEDRRFVKVGG
jgi:hypothetical protein